MVSVRNAEAGAKAVRIGEWVVDPATNELRRGTETVRIEPRAMDLLMALARRAGAVVSREELLAEVWPGMVVGDEALSQAITKLRRALGDDPRSPRYIETISKRGYRLLAKGPRKIPRGLLAAVTLSVMALALLLLLIPREPAPTAAVETAEDRNVPWITVTVLPFETLGGSPGQDYFARGIGEALMTELGRLSALRLISASGVPSDQAARRASYAVSGSVQREPATIRINVRLIDTRTNAQLWSERFERPPGDLFAVQDEIVRKLAEALPARLNDSERARLAHRHTRSLEAYDLFLRAQALFLARGARENLEARELYRKAIELDPKFARAYAGLAMTHAIDHRLSPASDPAPSLERALQLAETAREIDPDIAEVHWSLGFVHAQARRHPQAIESLQRAIELNRSFADAYALMGGIFTYLGQPAKSIPLLRTALRLEPDGGYLYYLLLGRAYFFENDLEQALINLRAALSRNPADLETHIYLAAVLGASGNASGAEWEAQEIRSLDRGFTARKWLDAYPMSSPVHREKLARELAKSAL